MTHIVFMQQGAMLHSVDILGHTGYAAEGEDIVCAAISSAVMLTHALLFDVQKIEVDALIEDNGVHIRLTLPDGEGMVRGQDALQALKLYFTELMENYPEFIDVSLSM